MPWQNEARKPILAAWAGILLVGIVVVGALDAWQVRHALQVREMRPETYLAAAEKAMNGGDFPGALIHWEEAHRRAPESDYVYKVLGDIHYNLKSYGRALEAYRRALDLGSKAPGVRANLLWCLVETGKHPEAMDFGRACIKEGLTDPDIYRRTAEACFRAKRFADSIPLYEAALKGFPNDLYLMEHLRQGYQAVGDYGRARQMEKDIAQVQAAMTALQGKAE